MAYMYLGGFTDTPSGLRPTKRLGAQPGTTEYFRLQELAKQQQIDKQANRLGIGGQSYKTGIGGSAYGTPGPNAGIQATPSLFGPGSNFGSAGQPDGRGLPAPIGVDERNAGGYVAREAKENRLDPHTGVNPGRGPGMNAVEAARQGRGIGGSTPMNDPRKAALAGYR